MTETHENSWLGTDAGTPAGVAWQAVYDGDIEQLDRVLADHGSAALKTAQGPIGHPVTALAAAAKRGDSAAVKRLLKAGADPNVAACGHMTQSPVAWAIRACSLTTTRLLLNAGAEPTDDEDLQDIAVLALDPVVEPHNYLLAELLKTMVGSTDAMHRAVERLSPQWTGQLVEGGGRPERVVRPRRHAAAGGRTQAARRRRELELAELQHQRDRTETGADAAERRGRPERSAGHAHEVQPDTADRRGGKRLDVGRAHVDQGRSRPCTRPGALQQVRAAGRIARGRPGPLPVEQPAHRHLRGQPSPSTEPTAPDPGVRRRTGRNATASSTWESRWTPDAGGRTSWRQGRR